MLTDEQHTESTDMPRPPFWLTAVALLVAAPVVAGLLSVPVGWACDALGVPFLAVITVNTAIGSVIGSVGVALGMRLVHGGGHS